MNISHSFFQWLARPVRHAVRWYLRKPRWYQYQGLRIRVMPGVFHPGFFHSTGILIRFLNSQSLRSKSFLELGCGTGLISIIAAQRGAFATASDISPQATENAKQNAELNQVSISVAHSDLFERLEGKFDWIVINPPYYPKRPQTAADHAWFCGENHEYFEKLFAQLPLSIHGRSKVLIILSDVCDLHAIFEKAKKHSLQFSKILAERVWVDGHNTLYWIESMN